MTAERRRWRVTRRPGTAVALGALWLVVAGFDLYVLLTGEAPARWYQMATFVLAVVLAVVYLTSAALHVRELRRNR
jgi:hypothetical protein